MVSHTLTAAIVLGKNGYALDTGSGGDFTAVNTEYLMDDMIDFIDGQVGSDVIPSLSGTAGSKTVTITGRNENAAFSFGMTIALREGKKTSLTGSSTTNGSESSSHSWTVGQVSHSEGASVGQAIGASTAINNESNSPESRFFWEAIAKLKAEATGEIESDLA